MSRGAWLRPRLLGVRRRTSACLREFRGNYADFLPKPLVLPPERLVAESGKTGASLPNAQENLGKSAGRTTTVGYVCVHEFRRAASAREEQARTSNSGPPWLAGLRACRLKAPTRSRSSERRSGLVGAFFRCFDRLRDCMNEFLRTALAREERTRTKNCGSP